MSKHKITELQRVYYLDYVRAFRLKQKLDAMEAETADLEEQRNELLVELDGSCDGDGLRSQLASLRAQVASLQSFERGWNEIEDALGRSEEERAAVDLACLVPKMQRENEHLKEQNEWVRAVPFERGPDGEPGPPDIGAYLDLQAESAAKDERISELEEDLADTERRRKGTRDTLDQRSDKIRALLKCEKGWQASVERQRCRIATLEADSKKLHEEYTKLVGQNIEARDYADRLKERSLAHADARLVAEAERDAISKPGCDDLSVLALHTLSDTDRRAFLEDQYPKLCKGMRVYREAYKKQGECILKLEAERNAAAEKAKLIQDVFAHPPEMKDVMVENRKVSMERDALKGERDALLIKPALTGEPVSEALTVTTTGRLPDTVEWDAGDDWPTECLSLFRRLVVACMTPEGAPILPVVMERWDKYIGELEAGMVVAYPTPPQPDTTEQGGAFIGQGPIKMGVIVDDKPLTMHREGPTDD